MLTRASVWQIAVTLPSEAMRAWARLTVLLLAAIAMAGMLALTAVDVRAQGSDRNWFDGLSSYGAPSFSDKPKRKSERDQERPDDVNDLRPDAVPWRSDEMLYSIERAIARYERIVANGGWPKVEGTRMIRPGDSDERVPVLRRQLRVTGDLANKGGYYDDYTLDSQTEDAVRRFQERHGLRPSGRVDRPTLAALSITAEERLDQLKLNYDRIAGLIRMAPTEDRYVMVNAPAFQLEAVERHQVEQRHRVIVGRQGRDTPELKATIKALNFFPYWKVPDSVAQLDLIPRLQKEPDYLYKEQFRVLQGDFNGTQIDPASIDWMMADAAKIKFRQEPGDRNALGLVRIDMQNEHGVYMHDTPLKELFQQRSRPFSAGCVRVQDVFQLVEWLARYEVGWEQPGQVQAVLDQGQPLDVTLTRPVPVYFAYITAWAESDGLVEFRADIYDRDGHGAVAQVIDPDNPPPPPPAQGLAP